MKAYVVGGSVRDRLLGLPVKDRDHVVVGSTPEAMIAEGFKPVGADFPVFLHPVTHEEYALARTERKSGKGYKGFTVYASPEVTLEEDLARRDLTLNAMAEDESGRLVDPYGGRRDLEARVLRHVGPAFAEDPVRILRVARFAARFADRGFTVADETMQLMRSMVDAGEADHLVPERVWQEIARGLTESRPSALFHVLRESGALARVAPEWEAANVTPAALDNASADTPLDVRFTVLCAAMEEATIASLCDRLRTPADCRDLALAFVRARPFAERVPGLSATEACALFDTLDALRRPDRLERFQLAWALSQRARGVDHAGVARHAAWIDASAERLRAIDFGAVAGNASGRDIPGAIRAAKLAALQSFLDSNKDPRP